MGKSRLRARREIGEPRSHGDDQVGLGGDFGARGRAGHAEPADRPVRGFAHGAFAPEGLSHGDAAGLCEGREGVPGFRVVDAAARDDHRPFRLLEQFDRLRDPRFRRRPALHAPDPFLEEVGRIVVGVGLHVLGQRDRHRARIRRIGEHAHGLRQGGQQLFGPVDPVEETADRAEAVVDAHLGGHRVLEFLQHRALVPGGVVVGRQQEHGQAVDRGRGRAGQHVGRTRADGCRARDGGHAVVHLGVTRGRVHHGLLVAGLVVGQVLPVLEKGLAQSGHVPMAEYAEYGGDESTLLAVALAVLHGQILDHRLRRGQADLIVGVCHGLLLR